MFFLSALAIAFNLYPTVSAAQTLDSRLDTRLWPILLAVHLFTSLSPLLMKSIVMRALRQQSAADEDEADSSNDWKRRELLLTFGAVATVLGNFAEIVGHFRDGWIYEQGQHSSAGLENFVFCFGLSTGLSSLALALMPSPRIMSMSGIACILPTGLFAFLPVVFGWNQSTKPIAFALQSVVSMIAAVAFGKRFQTNWSILYFAQAVNIIRNASRMLQSGNQVIHGVTSFYGWFSFTVPFALGVSPVSRASPLPVVLAVSVLSILGGTKLEDLIMERWTGTVL